MLTCIVKLSALHIACWGSEVGFWLWWISLFLMSGGFFCWCCLCCDIITSDFLWGLQLKMFWWSSGMLLTYFPVLPPALLLTYLAVYTTLLYCWVTCDRWVCPWGRLCLLLLIVVNVGDVPCRCNTMWPKCRSWERLLIVFVLYTWWSCWSLYVDVCLMFVAASH